MSYDIKNSGMLCDTLQNNLEIKPGIHFIPEKWIVNGHKRMDGNFLTFIANTTSTVEIEVVDYDPDYNNYQVPNIEYSRERTHWYSMTPGYPVRLNEGDTIYLRGENDRISLHSEAYTRFVMTGSLKLRVESTILT